MRPPRLMAARKLDRTPAVKARMRKSGRRNMGSATLVSMSAKATSRTTPVLSSAMTEGLSPAHGVAAVGLDTVGDADHDGDETQGEGDVARPVDTGAAAHAALL